MPCPPPYLYGLVAIWLPASIIALTVVGADAGATARPSVPSIASSVAGGGGPEALARVCPDSIAWRSAAPSARVMRPSTGRPVALSHVRTRLAVPLPYIPSTVV